MTSIATLLFLSYYLDLLKGKNLETFIEGPVYSTFFFVSLQTLQRVKEK